MRFDVLDRHLNVFAPHFLEASAGTGKTFAIEHLAIRLLIEGPSPLTIQQILIVTFTRAAARELKKRIRSRLECAKRELENKESEIDYIKAIFEKGEKAIQQAKERIDAALICYDAASIYTLHGFCHRLLHLFALEADVGMQMADPDAGEYLFLLRQEVARFLKEELSSSKYSPTQMNLLLNYHQKDVSRMIEALVNLAANRRPIAAGPHFQELLEAFLQALQQLPSVDARDLREDLISLSSVYKQMTGKEVALQMALLSTIIATKQCTPLQFDQLLANTCFLEKMREENRKIRSKPPGQLHYPDLLEQLRKRLLPIICAAQDPVKIFLRLGKDLAERAAALLQEKETFTPDGLLENVRCALQRPEFVASVQKSFKAAIIDEFQDTDPIQWEIFHQLFFSKVEALCLVGDPKQSIYAFRSADLDVYFKAQEIVGHKKYLDTNFRSTASLVEALNLLFSKGRMDDSLTLHPVKSGARISFEENLSPIEFFVVYGKASRGKFPTTDMLETKIFPYIASEMIALHRKNGIPLHEMAVLVKDRYQADQLLDFLKQCGISANVRRGRLLTETPGYSVLKQLLAAALSPSNGSALKISLGSPLFARSAQQLIGSSVLEFKARMQELAIVLRDFGIGPFFQRLLMTHFSGKPLLEDLIARGELSLYLEMRKLIELLIAQETKEHLTAEGLLIFLESMHQYGEGSDFQMVSQEESASVAILTTHMSKGLEFDVVFALGISSRHSSADLIAIKTKEGSLLQALDLGDPSCIQALKEINAEKMRQLYVALTRARKRLYVPLMIEEEKKERKIDHASPIELFFREMEEGQEIEFLKSISPLISYQVLGEMQAPTFSLPSSNIILQCQTALHLPNYEQKILSFSALTQKTESKERIEMPENLLLGPHALPLGAETGEWIHLILEKIFKQGLHNPLDLKNIHKLIEKTLLFSPLEPYQSIFLPWIEELLTQPLCGFSLADISHDQLQQEMEFAFPTQEGIMKGFADLVFMFEDKYYLLDWKSNYLGSSDSDYTQEKMHEAMVQHQYHLQASIYQAALERYVKLFDNPPFSECFGGAIYYFVRGKGVYHFFPAIPK